MVMKWCMFLAYHSSCHKLMRTDGGTFPVIWLPTGQTLQKLGNTPNRLFMYYLMQKSFCKHFRLQIYAETRTLETSRCLWVGLNTQRTGRSFWKSMKRWMEIPLGKKWGNHLSTFGASLLPASHLSLKQSDTFVDEKTSVLTIKQWAKKDICRHLSSLKKVL